MPNFLDSPPLPPSFCVGAESDEDALWVHTMHATPDDWRVRAQQRAAQAVKIIEAGEGDDTGAARFHAEAEQAKKIARYLDRLEAACLLEITRSD